MDVWQPVFMVRDAAFGADFTSKLVLSLVAVGLTAWDAAARRRLDYVWVFLIGTVLWTLTELALQLRGTRVMPEHLLFGAQIPLGASALLQGMSEGALVAVVGLFAADRVRDPATRWRALVGFGFALLVMVLLMAVRTRTAMATDAPVAASRRDMTAVSALLPLALVVAFDVWFWVARPRFRSRSLAMALAMALFATVWTVTDVILGGRWVQLAGSAPGSYVLAPTPLAAGALVFDVVVEIVLAYVPFFAIPALAKLIPAGHRAPIGEEW